MKRCTVCSKLTDNGDQRCPTCGRELVALTFDQILAMVEQEAKIGEVKLLAPLVRSRKGIYRDLFMRLKRLGFETVLVDGGWMPPRPMAGRAGAGPSVAFLNPSCSRREPP
mgnify:CR=1 FL=1